MNSEEQWKNWVESIVDQRERVFTSDPDDMVGAFRREVEYSSDYHGRELLELLQNADDASPGEPRTQQATVVLHKEGLCFANTGEPFSESGVKSLMVSNNSPKKSGGAKYIGNRGLGFRSVLGWTNSPFILSGNLNVGFDRRRAERWLEDLAERDDGIRRKVEEETRTSGLMPIPTLAIPSILEEQNTASYSPSEEPNFAALWSLAHQLRADGYDTVVALPFTESSAFAEARAQLARMGREVLLFLHHIKELVIRSPQGQIRWTAHGSDSNVEIESDEEEQPPSRWEVFSKAGTIPDAYLRRDQMETPDYEIRLAIPSEGTTVPEVLFNYFPTRIHLPLPLISHATVELTSNRENLSNSSANRYLLRELARFMAETAESTARVSDRDSDPWTPLSLVTLRGSLDPVMRELGFRETLVETVTPRELVPVRDGRKLAPTEARRLDVASAAWLPELGFEDVVVDSDDPWLIEMVKESGSSVVSSDELRERLDLCSDTLPVTVRASLVAELLKASLMPNPPPALLIDRVNKTIDAGTTPFLPPVGGAFHLPDWIQARVLHEGFVEALRTEFGGVNAVGLAGRLSIFGLQPYSGRELARHINRATERGVWKQPELEENYRLAGLSALFRVYEQSSATDEQDVASRQTDLRVKLPTRTGLYAFAETLYFGEEYPRGDLTEIFYGRYASEKMVALPDALGLGDNKVVIGEFLAWLGVASEPRIEKIEVRDQDYLRYVRDQLNYPAYFGEEVVETAERFVNSYLDLHVTDAMWVDGLDRLLEDPDPYAIVYWLALDRRIEDWRRGDASAELKLTPSGKRALRSLKWQTIPSYVTWLLQRQRWLPASDKTWRAPVDCTLAPNLPEKAKSILPRPSLKESDEAFQRLGIDWKTIRRALELVGVTVSIDDLPWEDFYNLLLRLPELDPNGEHARAVYRLLISRTDENGIQSSAARRRFLNEGSLWARQCESAGYCRMSEGVYYADDATIPSIVQEMPILDLERGKGSQKVERLFGATPFSAFDVDVEIDHVDLHPRAADLKNEVERLKPYVYAMRSSADVQARGLIRLRNLSVVLCHGAVGRVLVRDEEHDREHTTEISLTDGQTILEPRGAAQSDGETAYLCTEADGLRESRMLTDDIAYDVGSILANVLGVENVGDFAALAQCSPDRRRARLQKMLGTDPQDFLDEARNKLELGPDTGGAEPWEWPPHQGKNGGDREGGVPAGGGQGAKPSGENPPKRSNEVTLNFGERLELLNQGKVAPVRPVSLRPGGEGTKNTGENGGGDNGGGRMPVAQIKVGEGQDRKKRELGDEGERWVLAAVVSELMNLDKRARATAIDEIVELLERFEGNPVNKALAYASSARRSDRDDEEQIKALAGLLHVSQYSDAFGFDLLGWTRSGVGEHGQATCLEVKNSAGGEFHLSRGEWALAEQLHDASAGNRYAVLVVRRASGRNSPDAMHLLSDPVGLVKAGSLRRVIDGYWITYLTTDS